MSPGLGVLLALVLAASSPVFAQPAPPAGDIEHLLARGHEAFMSQDFTAALRHFERALRLEPDNAFAHLGAAESLLWLQRCDQALPHYAQVLAQGELAHAHNGIGHCQLQLWMRDFDRPRTAAGRLDRAEREFLRALSLEPGHRPANEGLAHVARLRSTAHPLSPLSWVIGLLLALLAASYLPHLSDRRAPRSTRASLRARASGVVWPLSIFALSRGLLVLSIGLSPLWLSPAPGHPLPILHHDWFVLDAAVARWDANLYAKVALQGYWLGDTERAWFGGVGQFPLLPVLLRATAYVLDSSVLAGVLLPNAALLAASILLFFMVERAHGRRLAIGATLALLVHPGSLFGSVLYAEPLLLLGALAAAHHAQRGQFARSALWGALAGLSRINALALCPLLLWAWWRQRKTCGWAGALSAGAPALAVLIYGGYLQLEFGDFMAYFHEMRGVRLEAGNFAAAPVDMLRLLQHTFGDRVQPPGSGPLPLLWLATLSVLVYLACGYRLMRSGAYGEGLFVLSGVALSLGSTLPSQPRYLWVLFPALVCAARACDRPRLRQSIPLLSLGSLLLCAAGYAQWYFVT